MQGKHKTAVRRADGAPLYGTYLISIAVCLVGNLFIRMSGEAGWLSPTAHVLIGLAAAAPLAFSAVRFWRMLRQELDEMLQRVVLEGMAFALVIYLPLAALYVNMRAAGAWTPRLDPPDLLLGPAVLVALGIALAIRRYS
jgi:hypothetical protein